MKACFAALPLVDDYRIAAKDCGCRNWPGCKKLVKINQGAGGHFNVEYGEGHHSRNSLDVFQAPSKHSFDGVPWKLEETHTAKTRGSWYRIAEVIL